jgi:hypothetical protein
MMRADGHTEEEIARPDILNFGIIAGHQPVPDLAQVRHVEWTPEMLKAEDDKYLSRYLAENLSQTFFASKRIIAGILE